MKAIMGEKKKVSPKIMIKKLTFQSLLLMLIFNDKLANSSLIQKHIKEQSLLQLQALQKDDENLKLEAIEAMAYTENAIMNPNEKIKIQDEQKKIKVPKKKKYLEKKDQLNEDQAIAAYQIQSLQKIGVDAAQEMEEKKPKKQVEVKKQVEKKQENNEDEEPKEAEQKYEVSEFEKQLPESTVDLSSISQQQEKQTQTENDQENSQINQKQIQLNIQYCVSQFYSNSLQNFNKKGNTQKFFFQFYIPIFSKNLFYLFTIKLICYIYQNQAQKQDSDIQLNQSKSYLLLNEFDFKDSSVAQQENQNNSLQNSQLQKQEQDENQEQDNNKQQTQLNQEESQQQSQESKCYFQNQNGLIYQYFKDELNENQDQSVAQTNISDTPNDFGLSESISETLNQREQLKIQLIKEIEMKKKKEQQSQQKKDLENINDSMWGQLENVLQFQKTEVTKAQGYEDPEEKPVNLEPVEEKKVLSKEEQEKQYYEKMKLFSEFVSANAEASKPIMKKEEEQEKPLHFKYYPNEGEEITQNVTDNILGAVSEDINKRKIKLKYDHSDSDWGVSPIVPVDYTKAQFNLNKLLEPIQTVEIEDVQDELKRLDDLEKNQKSKSVELQVQ